MLTIFGKQFFIDPWLGSKYGLGQDFTESCFSLLMKVYIKQSEICDTLPRFKMGLFPTIGICKVIICRLMILYTKSACYWFHSILTCFHLKTSEKVLFVTIAIAYAVFYWIMASHTEFFSMNFLLLCQFVSEHILLQVAPPCSSWFQIIVVRLRWFLLVPDGSSLFLVVPAPSVCSCKCVRDGYFWCYQFILSIYFLLTL